MSIKYPSNCVLQKVKLDFFSQVMILKLQDKPIDSQL